MGSDSSKESTPVQSEHEDNTDSLADMDEDAGEQVETRMSTEQYYRVLVYLAFLFARHFVSDVTVVGSPRWPDNIVNDDGLKTERVPLFITPNMR